MTISKKTQTLLGVVAVGLVAYYVWNSNKKKVGYANVSGFRRSGVRSSRMRLGGRPNCPNGNPALKNQEPPINGKEDGFYHCIGANGKPYTLWNEYYL